MSRPIALITGAGRGIGRACAVALATDGFDVLLCDIADAGSSELSYQLSTSEDLDETARLCSEVGAEATTAVVDVRDEATVRSAVDRIEPERLTAVVTAAGIMGPDGKAWELSTADINTDLAVNLHGIANVARVTAPLLIEHQQGHGRFVAIASSAALRGLPRLSSYVAAKHAALGYVRSLAADLGPYGVTANAVLPGSTDTALLARSAKVYGVESAQQFAGNQRINRLIDPKEIASAVSFLCSERASAITGAAFSVDGGFIG